MINMLLKELASDKDVDWLDIFFALLLRYHNTDLYHGYSPNQLVFGRNKCWWNLPYDHPRMHEHFSTRLGLLKRRPSALLRNFRQIGWALPTRAEKNHKIWRKDTVFGSARAKLPRIKNPSSSPCGKVPLKLCVDSGGTVLRFVWM